VRPGVGYTRPARRRSPLPRSETPAFAEWGLTWTNAPEPESLLPNGLPLETKRKSLFMADNEKPPEAAATRTATPATGPKTPGM